MPDTSLGQSKKQPDLSFAQSGGRYRQQTIDGVYEGFKEAGVDFVVFLPDATLDGIEQHMMKRNELEHYQCVREDEGIAMAMGAYMVGRRPAMLMEGSGVGLCGLALARSVLARLPMLMICGHSSNLGERYDYHGTARLVIEPMFRALNIPHHVVMRSEDVRMAVVEGQRTVTGQKIPFAVVLPNHIIRE